MTPGELLSNGVLVIAGISMIYLITRIVFWFFVVFPGGYC